MNGASAPTMIPARVVWHHITRRIRIAYIMAALSLMTRDELASLGVDLTFRDHAERFVSHGFNEWHQLPAPLRRRLLQYLFGEDSKRAAGR